MVKTEDVTPTSEINNIGANLSLLGSWDEHSQPLLGTNDWTPVSFTFNSGDRSEITVAVRLGFWSGMTTGTAWFDDIHLSHVLPDCDPGYPQDHFLACYYQGTDPFNGVYIGSEEENSLGNPVLPRAFGINHDWETSPFGNISAIWRGRLYFLKGRYQFTTLFTLAFGPNSLELYAGRMLLIWVSSVRNSSLT